MAREGIDCPVLIDAAGDTGRAYGATTTPHMFIIDEQGILIYNGAIDDDPSGSRAAGQPVVPATTKPYGCWVKC